MATALLPAISVLATSIMTIVFVYKIIARFVTNAVFTASASWVQQRRWGRQQAMAGHLPHLLHVEVFTKVKWSK